MNSSKSFPLSASALLYPVDCYKLFIVKREVLLPIFLFLTVFYQVAEVAAKNAEPTKTNVVYGEYERSKLDFWKAESDQPTPGLVFFHGGGFKGGDKRSIHQFFQVDAYLAKGVSCITVNYPLLQHTGNDYGAIMMESKKAIEFIRSNAEDWNIDKKRIGAAGCSAGTLTSEWLGVSTDYISAMGVYLQPAGTPLFVLPWLNADFPPIMIFQASGKSDKIHHPDYAIMIKAACDKYGVECNLWGTGKNGINKLPDGKNHKNEMLAFFLKHWKLL
jgi:acetyl esterase/lipase